MRRSCIYLFLLILFVFSIISFNCSKSTTDSNKEEAKIPQEFVGTWNASQFILINNANPTQQVDLIQLRVSFTLVIQSNGNYTSTMTIPGDPTETETGTAVVQGNQITIDPDNDTPYVVTYTMSGNTFTMVDTDSEFDFDNDGNDEPATATIVLQKS